MTCGLTLLVSLVVPHGEPGGPGDRPPPANVAAMVKYLNENAGRMQSLTFTAVSMKVSQDGNTGSVDARLDCQRPRNFRLTGKAVGQPMVDLGSNSEEFWYWISKANPPYVYHCSYADLARPEVRIPFPFQPDMILAALGMAQYDPSRPYEIRVNNATRTVELIEATKSPQGQPVQKITVFRSGPVGRDEPIVVAHILRDAQGKDICKATVTHAQTDPSTGAVVPRRVQLVWPAEKMELTMKLEGLRVNAVDAQLAATLFSRNNLSSIRSFDLAHRNAREAKGALIGAKAGAVTGNVIARHTRAPKGQPLLSELIAILNETKSVDTFSVTVGVLSEMGPRAESAIPAIIRNAERLGFLKDHLLAKKDDVEANKRFVEMDQTLERTLKAILRKDDSIKTRHRKPSPSAVGENKQSRRSASVKEMALLAGKVTDESDKPAANATVLVVARPGDEPAPAPVRVTADKRGCFFIPGLDRGKQYRLTAQVKEANRIVAEGGVDVRAPAPCIIIHLNTVVPCVPCVPAIPPR